MIDKSKPVTLRASALIPLPFDSCIEVGRKVIYLVIHIPDNSVGKAIFSQNSLFE